jgi:1,4-dihydroxy-6-naphthoate synthase
MSTAATVGQTIRVGHSPDSDDAFMFYALTHDRIDTDGLRFVHQLEDIETLNRRAVAGELEVSAVSIHAYAHIADKYALLASGSSMGDRYGPKLITREPATLADLKGRTIAIPGTMTTAYLTLQLCLGKDVPVTVLPFDQILPAVLDGRADVGLIIHEGQLYYPDKGLHQVVDLGEWWYEQTGLPLPLGGNVVRRDLGMETVEKIARMLRRASSTPSTTVPRPWSTPSPTPATSTPPWPIGSSACTSTTGPSITAPEAARPSAPSSTPPPRPAFYPARSTFNSSVEIDDVGSRSTLGGFS